MFLLPLLFPDGRLPSSRWKPFVWFLAASVSLLFVSLVFGDPTFVGSSETEESLPNPLYVEAIGERRLPDPVFALVYFGSFAVAVTSMFVRFRAADGVERQQIKWVGFGFLRGVRGGDRLVLHRDRGTLSCGGGRGGGSSRFPASIGIAVLRFHLFDLDIVVRKTVLYAALAIFATAGLPGDRDRRRHLGRSRTARCSPWWRPSSSR